MITGGDSATGHDPERPGAMAGERVQSHQQPLLSGGCLAGGCRRPDLRAHPGEALDALRPGGRGDVSQSHRVWSFQNGPDVPTPVSDGHLLYSVGDKGIMWCLDAKSGKQILGGQRLKPGTYSSSPVLADGKIYVSNEDGVTSVVEAGPEFKILAENPLDDYCLSSPAISDGQIFIRTAERCSASGSAGADLSTAELGNNFRGGTRPARPGKRALLPSLGVGDEVEVHVLLPALDQPEVQGPGLPSPSTGH